MKYTIGELARSCGVPDSSLRYYERIGLLRPKGRTAGNYRYYGPDAVERLEFIRAAQAAGFDLESIRSMLAPLKGRSARCAEIQETVDTRLTAVRDQLRKLRHVEKVLLEFHQACEKTNPDASCPVIEQLARPRR